MAIAIPNLNLAGLGASSSDLISRMQIDNSAKSTVGGGVAGSIGSSKLLIIGGLALVGLLIFKRGS